MDMSGEYKIPAPREQVWSALNNPEVLKQAIPGCDELIKHGDTDLEAKVTAKVGPVKAKFAGNVRLENINAPQSYSIVGEGKGGAAGFAKGGADVSLEETADGTILRYAAKAEVGGKLASIGSRLIQGTSKKMADQFFSKFSEIVAAMEPQAAPASANENAERPAAASNKFTKAAATSNKFTKAVASTSTTVDDAAQTAGEAVDNAAEKAADAAKNSQDEAQKVADSAVETAKKATQDPQPTATAASSTAASSGTTTDNINEEPAKNNTGLYLVIGAVALVVLYFVLT